MSEHGKFFSEANYIGDTDASNRVAYRFRPTREVIESSYRLLGMPERAVNEPHVYERGVRMLGIACVTAAMFEEGTFEDNKNFISELVLHPGTYPSKTIDYRYPITTRSDMTKIAREYAGINDKDLQKYFSTGLSLVWLAHAVSGEKSITRYIDLKDTGDNNPQRLENIFHGSVFYSKLHVNYETAATLSVTTPAPMPKGIEDKWDTEQGDSFTIGTKVSESRLIRPEDFGLLLTQSTGEIR